VFVIGNFLQAVAWILDKVIFLYTIVILIHALLTWVRPDPFNPIVRTLATLSNLILDPIRRLVPMHALGIDLSPLLAILLLQFTNQFVVRSLMELAARM
jgi:YggT family protein